MKKMRRTGMNEALKQWGIFMVLYAGIASLGMSNTPQTHDVPMFHNDDGLGLLQDCTFMKARADGTIIEVPTTVAGRSVGCLSAIKSIVQVLYSLQESEISTGSCLPSADLDWLAVLDHVVVYMQNQPIQDLSDKAYGIWIRDSLIDMYPCQ